MTERDNLPRWGGRRGRHEAWYLTMSRGRDGYWIRYTVRSPIAGPAEHDVWFARFDREDPGRTFGIHGASRGDGVGMADPPILAGRAKGSLSGAGHEVRWGLRWETGGETLRLLPAALYRGGLAPTKPVCPVADARFGGELEVDGERISLEGVPGQQGHLWGTRHAERWAWAHCGDFEGADAVFQAVCGQSRRGPVRTPHLTFGALRWKGEWLHLRHAARRRPWGLGTWRLSLRGHGHRLEGTVEASPKLMVRACYLDPDDAPRYCHNTEVASARLRLLARRAGGWREVAELVSTGTTHAEWAGRTPALQVPAEHVEV